jgi:hypothetical protein
LVADRVASLIGLSDEVAAPEELTWAVRRFFEAQARERPLIAIVEDLHWAEPALLDLLDHLVDWAREAAILIIGVGRTDLLETRSDWMVRRALDSILRVEPLPDEAAAGLVDELLGGHELGDEMRARLMATADGNPLFIEQLVAMLRDRRARRRRTGTGDHDGETEIEVPATISSLLAARLDRLGSSERDLLERAAVVGRRFWWGAVTELSMADERAGVGSRLAALSRRDLIAPDRSEFVGDEAFRFRHLLIRDAAYRRLSKAARADLHERFAEWLRRRAAGRLAEVEAVLGYHLEQAYRYRRELSMAAVEAQLGELGLRAAGLLASAGRRALARHDFRGAANLLGRALELVPAGAGDRSPLMIAAGQASLLAGDLPRAGQLFADTVGVASEAGDRRSELHARLLQAGLGLLADPAAWHAKAASEADELEPELAASADHQGLVLVGQIRSNAALLSGSVASAEAATQAAIEHARTAGDREAERRNVQIYAELAWLGPTPVEQGLARCHALLREAAGDRKLEVQVSQSMARLRALNGDFDGARTLLAKARMEAAELGLFWELMWVSFSAGSVALLAGELDDAERDLRRAYDLLEARGERAVLSAVAGVLSQVLFLLGRDDEAQQLTEASERAAGDAAVPAQVIWRAARAKILARRGQASAAEALARGAVALAAGTDFLLFHADALVDLAVTLRLLDRPAEAAAAAVDAEALYERKGSRLGADHARALREAAANDAAASVQT